MVTAARALLAFEREKVHAIGRGAHEAARFGRRVCPFALAADELQREARGQHVVRRRREEGGQLPPRVVPPHVQLEPGLRSSRPGVCRRHPNIQKGVSVGSYT